jgi:hypothetical protein
MNGSCCLALKWLALEDALGAAPYVSQLAVALIAPDPALAVDMEPYVFCRPRFWT